MFLKAVLKGWDFPQGIYSKIHSPITTLEITCAMALTLQPIRGFPPHFRETGTWLRMVIHRGQRFTEDSDSQMSPSPIFSEGRGHLRWTPLGLAALYVTVCLRMISLRDNIKEGKERLQGPTLADCLERVDCFLLINWK